MSYVAAAVGRAGRYLNGIQLTIMIWRIMQAAFDLTADRLLFHKIPPS